MKVRRADDTHILVRNIPSDQVSQFRDVIHQQQYESLLGPGETAPGRSEWISAHVCVPAPIAATQENHR